MTTKKTTNYVADKLRKIKPGPTRGLISVVAVSAVFAVGVGSGVAYDHYSAGQSSTNAKTRDQPNRAPTPEEVAQRERQNRDRAVEALRTARLRTGKTLVLACQDPRASVKDGVPGSSQPKASAAALTALYDVEGYNAALHEYGTAADQFPAMTYRQVGIYTRDGARLAYFRDGSGQVQRDPVLDSSASVYGLDWCRSLGDFNAS